MQPPVLAPCLFLSLAPLVRCAHNKCKYLFFVYAWVMINKVSEQEALGLVSDQVQRRHKLVPIDIASPLE